MNKLTALALVLLGVAPATHAQWSLNLIADGTTPIPGGTGTFNGFGQVSIAGQKLLFRPAGNFGVYSSSGGSLSVVADAASLIPGTGTHFSAFTNISFDGTTPTFLGGGGSLGGIYASSAGSLVRLADNTTPVPGAAGQTFASFGYVARRDTAVSFVGGASSITVAGYPGAYLWNSGTLTRIADTSMPMPGTASNFGGFLTIARTSLGTAFIGNTPGSTASGVYTQPLSGGALITVADPSTPIPMGSGAFTHLGGLAADGDNLAFGGIGNNNQDGLYARIDGSLIRVADRSMTPPEGGSWFHFDWCAISGHTVAFLGQKSSGLYGLYAWRDGVISKIVAAGDTLAGRVLSDVTLSSEGVSGDTVAFIAHFSTGADALYTATIPAPATLSLLAATALLIPRRRRP